MTAPPLRRADRLQGLLAILGCVVCWGATPVMQRAVVDDVDGWTANAVRYPLAAILYWPILLVARREGSLTGRVVLACLVPTFFSFAGQIFWGLAPYHLTAAAIGFFVRLQLLVSIAGAMFLFADERRLLRSPAFLLGAAASLGGFVWFALAGEGAEAISASAAGLAVILLCSLFFGGYAVSVRACLTGIPTLVAFGVVAQGVSAGLVGCLLFAGEPARLADASPRTWLLLAGSSLLGIALGHLFLYRGVRLLGAAPASGLQVLNPLVTAALAGLFLGERLTLGQWLAGGAILAGAALLFHAQQELTAERDEPTRSAADEPTRSAADEPTRSAADEPTPPLAAAEPRS